MVMAYDNGTAGKSSASPTDEGLPKRVHVRRFTEEEITAPPTQGELMAAKINSGIFKCELATLPRPKVGISTEAGNRANPISGRLLRMLELSIPDGYLPRDPNFKPDCLVPRPPLERTRIFSNFARAVRSLFRKH